jgi:hypothetical protein
MAGQCFFVVTAPVTAQDRITWSVGTLGPYTLPHRRALFPCGVSRWRPGLPIVDPLVGRAGHEATHPRTVAAARDVLGADGVCEFDDPEKCAAYVAARCAVEALHRAARVWPEELADPAGIAAVALERATADCLDHPPATAARRRCVREAIVIAIGLASACDIARALGLVGDALDDAQRATSRAIALLAMFLHASAHTLD